MTRRRMLWLTPLIVVLVIVALVAWRVDDWRRDFVTNYAATATDSADPTLRPLASIRPVESVLEAVEAAAADLPRWSFEGRTQMGDVILLRFVRTTPLMRYRDDITVRVERQGEQTMVHAESRSRVGRGDLGQNPRNLRELLDAIRTRLKQ